MPPLDDLATRMDGAPARPAALDDLFRRTWDRVRVEHLLVRRVGGLSDDRLVHACVQLGTLLPLDIVVELLAEGPDGDTLARADAPRRMHTDHPLYNGSFAYEARVPGQAVLRARRIRVRVRPARPVPGTGPARELSVALSDGAVSEWSPTALDGREF